MVELWFLLISDGGLHCIHSGCLKQVLFFSADGLPIMNIIFLLTLMKLWFALKIGSIIFMSILNLSVAQIAVSISNIFKFCSLALSLSWSYNNKQE